MGVAVEGNLRERELAEAAEPPGEDDVEKVKIPERELDGRPTLNRSGALADGIRERGELTGVGAQRPPKLEIKGQADASRSSWGVIGGMNCQSETT